MASPISCPPTSHHLLPACAPAPPSAVVGKDYAPSSLAHFPHVQRVVIPSSNPKRPERMPILASAARRPVSDRVHAKWTPVPAPAEQRSDDGKEIDVGRPAKGGTAGERKRSALTAEKARVLRREMRATEIWRDAMYHSAIASRLASPDEH